MHCKKKDDSGDLGELKRLVNVLLKESKITQLLVSSLEQQIIQFLTKQYGEGFDRAITVEMPEFPQRKQLLTRNLENIQRN
jgi:hypothetical protein